MDDRDTPFVKWQDLSEKRKRLVKVMRPDLQPWMLNHLEFRFEFDRSRVAARSTAEEREKVDKLVGGLFPKPQQRLPEDQLSSCPTTLTIISQ